jgi:hypothetical protein
LPRRADAKTCCNACRQSLHRARQRAVTDSKRLVGATFTKRNAEVRP